ncbi:MAG TPA: acyltransferase [Ohtaekwangia sp.]|nr:acyltransferase [Ohtaekwangia sp.]
MNWVVNLVFSLSWWLQVKVDALYNSWQFRKQQVHYTGKVNIRGRIIIKNKGQIVIGENVTINNSSEFNPVGLPHPTILATLNPQATVLIGNNTGISGAAIVSAQKIIIGNNVLIGGGTAIWDTDFHPVDPAQRLLHLTHGAKSAPIVIADNVFIGARAVILKGVTIGKGAIVGAGAVVNKDVPENCYAVGNPAIIKLID